MSEFKIKVETLFERAARLIYGNSKKTLLISFLIIGFFISPLPNITFDTSPEGFLHENDPSRIVYNRFQEEFGLSNLIVISIEPREIFDDAFFEKLDQFHRDLENEVPFVRDVTSLMNVRDVRDIGGTLYVNELVRDLRETGGDMESLKDIVFGHPFYRNYIISEDRKHASVIIDLDPCNFAKPPADDLLGGFDAPERKNVSRTGCSLTGGEIMDLVGRVKQVIETYRGPDFKVNIAGSTVVTDIFNRYVITDMTVIMILSNITGLLILILFFRRASGVFMPNVIVNLALLSTIGMMVGLKIDLSSISSIIPAFLLAVGIADAIHILAIFYREYDKTGNKEDAISHAIGHSGLAVLMTSLTTAAGLLSFSFSEVADISEMGIFSAIGVVLALLYTLLMLPALIAVFPVKQKKGGDISLKKNRGTLDGMLVFFASFSTKHSKKIVAGSFLIFLFSLYGLSKLEFSENLLTTLPESETVRIDNDFINDKFRGVDVVEVIVDTREENGFYDPGILNKIDKITEDLKHVKEGNIFVGKVFSIVDFVKETNQALNGNNPEFYVIPRNRDMVAQVFLMFENSGSDALGQIVDSQFSKSRISIKIPYSDTFSVERFTTDVKQMFEREFKNTADITITGLADMISKSFVAADRSMAGSYKIAFTVITVMMIILVGSIKYGFLSMIPNLLPIVTVMGFMGAYGIPLDLNSLLIGSIAIGLVVDDTMHFMYNFRKYYYLSGDVYHSVKETLLGTGRAMMITSVVLISSFLCLLFGSLTIYTRFGFFTSVVIALALLADFVLAPALLTLVVGNEEPAVKPVEKRIFIRETGRDNL